MNNNKLRVFTSFTGIGSQEIALRNININYEVVGISEVDKNAILAYDSIHNKPIQVEKKTKEEMLEEFKNKNIAYNFSTGKSEIPRNEKDIRKLYEAHIRSKNYGDIRLINEKELPDFDLFTYSFPCKNISTAGKQAGFEKGSGTQSSLLWECERIIKEKRPKFLLMENVKNIVGKKHKPYFDEWCKKLEDLGYVNHWKVLNGKNFEVPQNRERCMMMSVLKEYDTGKELNEGKPTTKCIKDILENEVDEKYYLSETFYKGLLEHNKKHIEKGTGFLWKPRDINKYATCIRAGALCPTDNTIEAINNFEGKSNYRRFTPRECWRLQGISDEDFEKAKNIGGLSDTKLFERAGRAIVIPMLEDIFNTYLSEYKIK